MLTLKTWNGVSINDVTNYEAIIPEDAPLIAQAKAKAVQRSENWPVFAGKDFSESKLPILIVIHSGSMDALKALFNTEQRETYQLVATDGTEDWYLNATPITMTAKGPLAVTVVLSVMDPVWRSVTQYSSAWSVTASGQTKTITNAGRVDAYPSYEITPGSGSGGYAYRRFVKIWNKTALKFDNYPIEITGGLDTAALVTAGKMLATGDDVRVLMDGVEVPRWLDGINTSATKIWTVLGLSPMVTMTLGVVIPSTGDVGEISVINTTANYNALKKLPASGIVEIDSELFTYDNVNPAARKLGGVQRAAKDSSMAAHAAKATITWIEHDIWLMYGNSAAEAPVQDESHKPVFDLANSSNSSWVYDSLFSDGDGLRAGAWKPAVISSTGKESHITTATGGDEADPASVMGMEEELWYKAGKVMGETANLAWNLTHPAGITTIASTGNKQRFGTKWPALAALQRSLNGSTWTSVWNETTPADTTFTAWSRTATNINAKYARFLLNGSLPALEAEKALFEVGTATVALNTTYTPGVTLAAETGQTWLELTLENTTTGESIELKASTKTGKLVVVDTDEKTLVVDGQYQISALILSSIRRDWLRLAAGSNTLKVTYTSSPALTITTKWYKRML